ncbi:hypothetical protein K488DRAFT_79828 [Vararia minispora EC-137]|uniref:Uncharacterized protein n=1 Tax=Vararia minispora EC-137 TaxID=1314806 RepID=A0ACB8QE22_9AGAM|nr:hypothetical protein K488DRAFT_79828 [Vararia minispora EC-137]
MATNVAGQTALLIGATGQTGRHLLRELLNSPKYNRVLEAGRRVTPQDQLPQGARDKLEQRVVNFEKLDDARLDEGPGFDVIYITLGTTRKDAGSAENFERIDRQYVVNAAKAAKVDRNQRLIYLSSPAADPKSRFLYTRSKGLTEKSLSELGYRDTIFFHPGLLYRSEPRLMEAMVTPFVRVLSLFTNSLAIKVEDLARSMRIAGTLGSNNLPAFAQASKAHFGDNEFTVIGNAGSFALSKGNV